MNEAPPKAAVEPFVTNVQQMSFAGARSGEGYFSPDGRYMVFQSEREKGNPFYQIYLMDLKTGTTHRVSPGQGKTSCSWINPDYKHILFASTHADPELKKKTEAEWESRKNPKGKYSWSFDEAFDIYSADFSGHNLTNLTHSPGYDAEGSYSPDGQWIAFASNRAAYTEPMTDEQKKLFARDPSSMMDIYIMRADGRDVKRLTTAPGYDGGPFFSPDGSHLTFRRFALDGGTAEVYTIKTDGTDEKQLTHMKAMSWAPFYHPSGDYIIFASNKMGYQNFELYIVDTKGQHEPVRATDIEGFDGLPVFTPDGQHLVWTHSAEKGGGQLFKAQWNDALARKALGLAPATPQSPVEMSTALNAEDARQWVEYLASEHMEGRATGGAHEKEYLGTITQAFAKMGLKPVTKSYLQPYEFTSGVELAQKNALELHLGAETIKGQVGQDWIPLSFSKTGRVKDAGLIFVGYGIVAPATDKQAKYDSYAGIDVKDKWAVAFDGIPDDIASDRRFQLSAYSPLAYKAMMARQHGALGLVIIDDNALPAHTLALHFEGRGEDSGLPVLRAGPAFADKLFAANGTSREAWTKKLAQGATEGFAFTKGTLGGEIDLRLTKSRAENAVAMLKVPGAKTSVVIGAHGDHLGRGEMGNSLYRGKDSAVHHGADDNASGVAGVMEIAKDLTSKIKSGQLKLKQNVIFAVWTGEEIGVLGSTNFLKDNKEKISAYLNMDMIGRYRDQLMVEGTGSASEWPALIEKVNVEDPLPLHLLEDPYLPTDSLAFYMKQIPTLQFFTGSHAQYHSPSDTADLINYNGLQSVAGWVEKMTVALATNATSPVTYRKVEAAHKAGEGRSFRLYLGTIPDYSQDGKTGVVISGTSKDSPAEKAGLIAGDTIVELGGMKIQNLYDYVYCLQALKANQKVAMRVLRHGDEKKLEITPVLKNQ